jgi:hypothetical protein
VRQHVRHSTLAAVLDVVMDRMVVAARQLKRREQRFGHRAEGSMNFSPTSKSSKYLCSHIWCFIFDNRALS